MSPDVLHEEYYNTNPQGNHNQPSAETLRFMEKQQEFNKDVMNSIGELKEIMIEIRGDVKVIHEQTVKTNGRVNNFEQWLVENKEFIARLKDCEKNKITGWRNVSWSIVTYGALCFVTALLTILGAREFIK
jgi:hypothetical protein